MVDRDGNVRQAPQVIDFAGLEASFLGQGFYAGVMARAFNVRHARSVELIDLLHHMRGVGNQAALAFRGALQVLVDPGIGIGGEPITAAEFKLFSSSDEANDAVLHQIALRNAAVWMVPGKFMHQPDVMHDQAISRRNIPIQCAFQASIRRILAGRQVAPRPGGLPDTHRICHQVRETHALAAQLNDG